MKYYDSEVENEKDKVRKDLRKKEIDRMYQELVNSNPTMDSVFYKVDNALKNNIINDSKKEVINRYIGELLYYKADYYEQLLVNLGMEFKLRAYHLNKSDYNIVTPEINEMGETLIEEFSERCKFIMSRPLLEIYYSLTNDEPIGDDYSHNDKLMSVIKNFIKELLKMIYYNVRGIVRAEVTPKERPSKDALALVYYGYYLEYQDFCINQILDVSFSCIRSEDEPWTDDDREVYDFLNGLGFSLVSPRSDPLKAFYG